MEKKTYKSKDSRKVDPKTLTMPLKSLVKRNRQERKNAQIYRLESLLSKVDTLGFAVEGEVHHIEGAIDQYVVVSVPETTSYAQAERIKTEAIRLTGKPACVVSHNVTFLRAVKLSPKEAAEVVKQGENHAARVENSIRG